MKKSLLALAVLGAFAASAQAQTNVTIGGVVQANLKSYKVGGISAANAALGRQGNNELRVDDDYNSRFWLTGSEDLGGGNSAIFYVENRFNTDVNNVQGTGNGLSNGDTWLGLKGAWGQVTVGKHSWMSVQGLLPEMQIGNGGLAAIPTSMLGTYSILNQAGGYLDITRRNNSITYRTPNFSGFSGVVGVSTASAGNEGNMNCTGSGLTALVSGNGMNAAGTAASTTATTTCPTLVTAAAGNQANYNDGREYYLQGNYSNGPLYVNLAYRNHNVEGSTVSASNKQWRLSGTYKIAGFKFGLQYDRATNDTSTTSVSRTAWQIPLSYSFGSHTILGHYTRAGDLGGVADTGAKMFTLGYDYALSKRTNVGVYYSKLSNDTGAAYQPFLAGTSFTGSALAAGETATTWALGVKHTF